MLFLAFSWMVTTFSWLFLEATNFIHGMTRLKQQQMVKLTLEPLLVVLCMIQAISTLWSFMEAS